MRSFAGIWAGCPDSPVSCVHGEMRKPNILPEEGGRYRKEKDTGKQKIQKREVQERERYWKKEVQEEDDREREGVVRQMRAEELVKRLTTEEKISLLSETAPAIERMGIKAYHHGNEALHGVVRPGKFTVFPQAIAMGASFHPQLIQEVAEAISDEARAKNRIVQAAQNTSDHADSAEAQEEEYGGLYNGLLTFWSPNLNVARDPRWGRTGETYGEDPYLCGACGTAFVRGLQGEEEGSLKTVATPKHFVGNNEEHNRFECNAADLPRDQLFDYYLKPFEMAVKEGKCESVMAAYNAVNGIPCHASRELLTDILRGQWGFQGYVVSDCGAVSHLLDRHHYAGTPQEAAAAAMNAGVDLECGSCGTIQQVYRNYLQQALEEGLVTQERIDQAALRVLKAREKLGILDGGKDRYEGLTGEVIGCGKHQELALRMAGESIVLLKNGEADGGPILPLGPGRTICVIGNQADICQFGDYSGKPVHAPISILDGLTEEFGAERILHVPFEREDVGSKFRVLDGAYLYHYDSGCLAAGLDGAYDSADGRIRHRIDPRIEFEWENMAPDPLIGAERFRIVWQGILVPKSSGSYEFLVSVNQRECPCKGLHSFTLDGKPVKDVPLRLEAGREYSLTLEYENIGNHPGVALFWRKTDREASRRFAKELEAAGRCDVVLACLGFGTEQGAEGCDRMSLNLPEEQAEMLKAVREVNPNLIVTLYNGSSLTIPWLKEHAKGVLECWYPGEQGGRAIARVLSGRVNPSGRLPLTFYRDAEDLPSFQCYDISKGFTHWYAKEVLYPFGYGLSYTSFSYSGFRLSPGEDEMRAEVTIGNQGRMAGFEALQIYAEYMEGEPEPRRLVYVDKIWLEAGEERTVSFSIPDCRLEKYDTGLGASRVRSGRYRFMAAADAKHMILESLQVRGERRWNR